MMRRGASLDRVDTELIEPSGLTPDQQASLWLYAWSLRDGGQGPEAKRHLAAVEDGAELNRLGARPRPLI